ncbi:Protein of unknown function (DUF1644) [Quillaja saponaria]|uniref:Uncharacterized protein n=1 Tax=Quillaja saponaria TaxID=32244 RepID=A0AAD7L1Q3_QUISA|nr:Protein of unknown function (DUF1644) [Quillaja saponaria]
MPKAKRVHSSSVDRSRASPFSSKSKNADQRESMTSLASLKDVSEWEEARCPICMEHPHNMVLLKCSSHEMGCRPYMCNTSYRHSNCLDQFCKLYAPTPSTVRLQEIPFTSVPSQRKKSDQSQTGHTGSQLQSGLICPLCRGVIYGYMVLKPARSYMNLKSRSCSSETCEFSGTYSELRKHARSEHPSIRPSEADPTRRRDWTRMERERDLEDIVSTIQLGTGEEYGRNSLLSADIDTDYLLFLLLHEMITSVDDL